MKILLSAFRRISSSSSNQFVQVNQDVDQPPNIIEQDHDNNSSNHSLSNQNSQKPKWSKIISIIILSIVCLNMYGFFDQKIYIQSITSEQNTSQMHQKRNNLPQLNQPQRADKTPIQQIKPVQTYPQTFKEQKTYTQRVGLKLQQQRYKQILQNIKPLRANNLNLKTPELYIDTFKVKQSKQLPFCFAIRKVNTKNELLDIIASIKAQNYSNFQIGYSGPQKFSTYQPYITYNDVDKLKRKQIYALKKIVDAGCSRTSIVVPIRGKIKQNLLRQLNILYQRQNIWLTYDFESQNQYLSINSFYKQILDQITYDLISKYAPQNLQQEIQKFAYSLIFLTKYHAQAFPISWVYNKYPQERGIARFKGQISSKKTPYNTEPLMYFSPNHQTQSQVLNYLKKLNTTNPPENKYKPRNHITLPMMMKALQYYSLKDLPKNHTLFQRQIIEYQQKYHLSQYKKQVPLCIIIMSRDNIQNDRYRKVIQSIKIQNYSNYHIVFIDDASTDQTFQKTQQLVKQIGLNGRTQMLRNQKQMFATYNIQNAVHNYCRANQVAVLVDGDDQLIGRQVFKLINYGYQQKQNWIVYFSFFSTIYMYGVSQEPTQQFFQYNQPRYQMKVIGALRTFYVELYRKIKMQDHKDDQGKFFDSLYDDAMQHPMLQMSGLEHTRYIPEVVYFYNQDYSHNDGATAEGRESWKRHQKEVISRQKYKKLDRLFNR